jgi:hypothetical protein
MRACLHVRPIHVKGQVVVETRKVDARLASSHPRRLSGQVGVRAAEKSGLVLHVRPLHVADRQVVVEPRQADALWLVVTHVGLPDISDQSVASPSNNALRGVPEASSPYKS